jgi:hypothetical protein
VLAASLAPAHAAETLGRLFFTPEQRVTLDVARSKKTRVTLTTEKPDEAPPPPTPLPEVVTYRGLVQSSDGKTTVWLNNRAITEKDKAQGVVGKLRPDGKLTVQGSQSGRSVDLKVGQRAELLSGAVEEGYARTPAPAQPDAKPDVKTGETTAAAPAADRAKEERERQRDLEDAVRALKQTAENLRPTPPAAAEPQPYSMPPSR